MAELVRVRNCESPSRLGDVVFVHGLNGNPNDYWHPKGEPEKYWPAWLGEDLPDIGVWALGYENAALKPRYVSFVRRFLQRGFAMPLGDRAENVLLRLKLEGIGKHPVIFVGHSMGGLLVKQLLRTANDSNDPKHKSILNQTRGVCFIATPHIGSDLAGLAHFFGTLLGKNISIDELRPQASQLRELNRWYRNFVASEGNRIRTLSFYEMKPLGKAGLVVQPGDADPGIPNAGLHPLDEDHNSICKPRSRSDTIHQTLNEFVEGSISLTVSGEDKSLSPDSVLSHLSVGDIKDLIADTTNATIDTDALARAIIGELRDKLNDSVDRIQDQPNSASKVPPHNAFDAELDEVDNLLKGMDYQQAQAIIDRLSKRHWEEMTPQQKYRAKCGLASCQHLRGNNKEAGRLLLEAKGYCPESERAQINEVIGYEFLGDLSKARDLANDLITRFPHSSKLVACMIRIASDDTPFESLASKVTSSLESDTDVCLALANRALQQNRFQEAETSLRLALKSTPDLVQVNFLLGQTIFNTEAIKFQPNIWENATPPKRERLDESISLLSEAISIAESQHSTLFVADSLLCRAMAHALKPDNESAESDFQSSIKLAPDKGSVHHRYGLFLYNIGRIDDSIVNLKASVSLKPLAESIYFLANVLSDRGQGRDKAEALSHYIALVESTDIPTDPLQGSNSNKIHALRQAAFHAAIEEFVETGKLDEAHAFLDLPRSEVATDLGILTARSMISSASGEVESSTDFANKALEAIKEDSSRQDLRALASLLGKVGRDKDALPLWERVTADGDFGPDIRSLVTCAENLQRYDLIIRTAKSAREAGISDSWLFYKEVMALEVFQLDDAIKLLEDRLTQSPGEKKARYLLTQLGLKWHRPELIDARLESLPTPDEATPGGGAFAVEVLRLYGSRSKAVNYAYEFVRRNYNEPQANASLVMAFFATSLQPLVLPEPSEVSPGTAVHYSESSGKDKWIVIEDSPIIRPELSEFPVSHDLSKRLLGKRVGDEVVLSKTSGRDRTAVVKEIVSKYIYRMRDIADSWQLRFPDEPFIQVFKVASSDPNTGQSNPDFTDLQLIADNRFKTIQEAEAAFRTSLMPIHLFGAWVGNDPFITFNAVVFKHDLPIRSNRGMHEELFSQLENCRLSHELVVDLFALATVFLLDCSDLIRLWPGKLLISQTTATELKAALSNLSSRSGSLGFFGRSSVGYHLTEISSDSVAEHASRLASFIEMVSVKCEVTGCPELASLETELRDHLVSAFGQHGLESMILARKSGRILWTEDLAVGDVASSEFSVRRVWTQIVLEDAAKTSIVAPNVYLDASAKLLGLEFQTTYFNQSILTKAGQLAGWNSDQFPFNTAIKHFAHPGVPIDQSLKFAISLIGEMYRETILAGVKQATIIAILEQLAKRLHGVLAIRVLHSLLPGVFGVNVLAHDEVSKIIKAWLAAAERRPFFN